MEKWINGKNSGAIDEVIAETNADFEKLEQSHFLEMIGKIEKRWTKFIALKGVELNKFNKPKMFFLFSAWYTYYTTLVL